jgi:hypothetical protein
VNPSATSNCLKGYQGRSPWLVRREVLFWLDPSGLVSPEPLALSTDSVFSADGFYADLFALFDYRQLFFLAEARATP